jgi:hypothetical protein
MTQLLLLLSNHHRKVLLYPVFYAMAPKLHWQNEAVNTKASFFIFHMVFSDSQYGIACHPSEKNGGSICLLSLQNGQSSAVKIVLFHLGWCHHLPTLLSLIHPICYFRRLLLHHTITLLQSPSLLFLAYHPPCRLSWTSTVLAQPHTSQRSL